MTTTETEVPQLSQRVSDQAGESQPVTCQPVTEDQVAAPAPANSQRLSIFGGWCRLLVCLALVAAAQHWFHRLRSPSAPIAGPQDTYFTAGAGPQFMVDVNLAPQHELEALPEVGASLATRIVDYRQRQGPYRHIDDLLQVRGVGPRTLEQLRPMLLVRSPAE